MLKMPKAPKEGKAVPVKIVSGGGAMATQAPGGKTEDDWRAEDDHRTLSRAEEVRSDPKRMAGVKAHHRKKLGEMANISESLGEKRTMGDKSRPAKFRMASGRARSGR